MKARSVLPLAVLGLIAGSCANSGGIAVTGVGVTVDADEEVQDRATNVRITIRGGTGGRGQWLETYDKTLDPLVWPFSFHLLPRGGNARRGYEVEVVASDDDGKEFSEVRAISGFVPGKIVSLALLMEAPCIDVSCKGDESCVVIDGEGVCRSADIEATLEDAGGPAQDAWPDAGPRNDGGRNPDGAAIGDGSSISDADIGGGSDAADSSPPPPCNDSDGDGLCADSDNCPVIHNPSQVDDNNNGIGNVCDWTCDNVNIGDSADLERPAGANPVVVRIRALTLNGQDNTTTVAPGADVEIAFNYQATDVYCIESSTTRLVLMGFHNGDEPVCPLELTCGIDDADCNFGLFSPMCTEDGTATATLKAPDAPGGYYLVYEYQQTESAGCGPWQGDIPTDRIGAVCVAGPG